MIGINKRSIGTSYEIIAKEYLIKKEYDILCMNYRCKFGEIDIIAKDNKGFIVFVEVKFRTNTKFGMPYEAVNKAKQRTIFLCSENYIKENGLSFCGKYRYDVISIKGKEILHIENAFGGL